MPKILKNYIGLSFYFWSNEKGGGGKSEPAHIHVSRGDPSDNSAKFWIRQNGMIELAHNKARLSDKELKRAIEYIEANKAYIVSEWYFRFKDNENA